MASKSIKAESRQGQGSVFPFIQSEIAKLKQIGKERTSETYAATLKSFMGFRQGKDLLWTEMDSDIIRMYENYLQNRGLTRNSSSFYMRILRAVYHRAVEKGLTEERRPFKQVYTGIDKTIKRAIPLSAIKRIKELDLSARPSLDFARDMFLFSFYTRGMSFIDMAYLKKKDLQNGMLVYRRRKTGQRLMIKWEKCMQEIVDKYDEGNATPYLLPILKGVHVGRKRPGETLNDTEYQTRRAYKNALSGTNRYLKEVARLAGIGIPLSMYVSRHSWASIAKSKNIPVSIISEGMGHDSETTTKIYLASLENCAVDRANAQILKGL